MLVPSLLTCCANQKNLTKKLLLDNRSIELRNLVIRALDGGKRGHLGSAFSLIEQVL